MTLVAAFAINNYPTVMGDILISAKGNLDAGLELPSVRRIRLPNHLPSYPLGMRQKLALISDSLCIGWTGNAKTAHQHIQKLRQLNEAKPFTKDSLLQHFAVLESETSPRELGLVGHIREPNSNFNWFVGLRGAVGRHPVYGPVAMIGSGVKYLQVHLDRQVSVVNSEHGLKPAQFSVLFALQTAGELLGHEFLTQGTLENLFGAGYEFVVLRDTRLEKLDGITYLFWIVNPRTTEFKLMHAFKYWYVSDVLWIRKAQLERTLEVSIRPEPYPVLPIDRPACDNDFDSPPPASFESNWICHVFYVAHPKTNFFYRFPLVLHNDSTDRHITFQENQSRLTFQFGDENEIIQLIENAYSEMSE